MKKFWVTLVLALCISKASASDVAKAFEAMNHGNYAAALAEFTPLAKSGNKQAQQALAVMYQYGRGVPVDYVVAFSWYQRSAMQGYPESEADLGFMYEQGLGVPKNYAKPCTGSTPLPMTRGRLPNFNYLRCIAKEREFTPIKIKLPFG